MVSDNDFKKVQDDLKRVTDILFGVSDDPRFKAKVRKQVIDRVANNGKPVIISNAGKRWQIDSVTELN